MVAFSEIMLLEPVTTHAAGFATNGQALPLALAALPVKPSHSSFSNRSISCREVASVIDPPEP